MDKLYALVPRDKLLHLVVGGALAIVAAALWSLAMHVPAFEAHPVAVGLSLGGLLAGAQKEGTDRLDNLIMYHRGEAPIHGVEWGDWLMTWAGATVVAMALVRGGWA